MPLEPELLELEQELRQLVPLEMDFPNGQRVMDALTQEIEAYQAAQHTAPVPPSSWHVLPGGLAAHAAGKKGLSVRWGWAAAAVLVAGGGAWLLRDSQFVRQAVAQVVAGEASGEVAEAEAPAAPRRARIDQVYPSYDEAEAKFFTEHTGGSYDILARRDQFPTLNRPTRVPEAPPGYGFLDVRQAFALPPDYCKAKGIAGGVVLSELGADGPAAMQGLEPGDIVLSVDGRPMRTTEEFCRTIRNTPPGSVIKMRVRRGNLEAEVKIRLGAAPSA